MELGMTGLPLSGKTTLFNALTGQAVATGGYTSPKEAHRAVVKVPDQRLDALAALLHPKTVTPAEVHYLDVAGVAKGGGKDATAALYSALKAVDAVIHVVRAFRSATVPEPAGGVNPGRDIVDLNLEIALIDLEQVERRIDRIEKEFRSGKKESEHEFEVLRKCREALNSERPLRELDLAADDEKCIRGFQFLTRKPMILVVNVGDEELGRSDGIVATLKHLVERRNVEVVPLSAELEMEIAQLDEADRPAFLEELGIGEPAVHRLIRVSYHTLDLISFFTVVHDELRAWTVRRGSLAPQAAGAVHTDMERGFIRAEVVHYDDFVACGSMAHAKEKGLLRLEGKTYEVKDGDILTIRFNV